jgi:rhamnosyltransferase
MKAVTTPDQSVCAVIVTYHPSSTIADLVARVLAQVQALVVVDNGSTDDERATLRGASRKLGFHLIENGENLGIAEALNQGVRWAKGSSFSWVVFFDQDSRLTEGFIDQMFAAWKSHPCGERVGSIHCRHIAPDTGSESWIPRTQDGSPVFPMTSGSLMPVWIFDKIGWFASEYFIDVVDWEYAFRTRAAGFLVADSRQAKLLHAPGNPAENIVLGHTFRASHHDSLRRYYITRNCIVFYRKYFRLFPGWIARSAYDEVKKTIVSLIFEQNRTRKFRNLLLGAWDGLSGRMGKREGL